MLKYSEAKRLVARWGRGISLGGQNNTIMQDTRRR